jgi:hypothetical protein
MDSIGIQARRASAKLHYIYKQIASRLPEDYVQYCSTLLMQWRSSTPALRPPDSTRLVERWNEPPEILPQHRMSTIVAAYPESMVEMDMADVADTHVNCHDPHAPAECT